MNKTNYNITRMECPSEEQAVRLKLEGLHNIKAFNFQIPQRMLLAMHEGDASPILITGATVLVLVGMVSYGILN